jgi:DNA-directed RNA polymerase specialized sigma24 family protein
MDASALLRFLTEERARFVRIARQRLPDAADAEDVVQRAMTLATERAASLEDAARVRAWFGSIVRRQIADFYRSRPPEAVREVLDTDAVLVPEPRGNPCACSVKLLGELRPAYADVLRRVDVDGESPEAVAVALGVSLPNLYVRLHRARRALRESVKKHCGVATCGPCLDCTCDAHGRCGKERAS